MQTYILKFVCGDVRECELDGDWFIHVLHRSWRMHRDDPRITEIIVVKPCDIRT
jgi:hypothetical protein